VWARDGKDAKEEHPAYLLEAYGECRDPNSLVEVRWDSNGRTASIPWSWISLRLSPRTVATSFANSATTSQKSRSKKRSSSSQAVEGEGGTHSYGAKRIRKICTHEGCTNIAVNGGVCISHGAKRKAVKICTHEGCTKQVVNGGVCTSHGAKVKLCEVFLLKRYKRRVGTHGI